MLPSARELTSWSLGAVGAYPALRAYLQTDQSRGAVSVLLQEQLCEVGSSFSLRFCLCLDSCYIDVLLALRLRGSAVTGPLSGQLRQLVCMRAC
jgi:hypothetical protein